jgi:restriction endonuclease S subunit
MKGNSRPFVEHPRLGRLPADWSVLNFREITEPIRNPVNVLPGTTYREIGIRSHGKGIFHKEPLDGAALGDKRVFWVKPECLIFNIVFAWEGAVATTSSAETGMIGSHRFPMHEPHASIADVEFLRRFFQTQLGIRLLGDASPGGAGRNRTLNQRLLADTPVPLPPLPEQRKIAAILSSIDDGIRKSEGVIKQLQVVKEAMMQELLTRGLPGRHMRFKKTEIGEIPEDWEPLSIGNVVSFSGGSQPPKSTFSPDARPGYVRLIQIRDYKTDRYRVYIPSDSTRRFCSADDVMIGRYGPPIFQILRGLEGAYNVALMKAIPNEARLSKDYLYLYLKLEDLFLLIDRLSQRTSGQTGVDVDALRGYRFPLPPLQEQKDIVGCLESMQHSIDAEASILVAQQKAKSALMSALLTGELRVTPDQEAA